MSQNPPVVPKAPCKLRIQPDPESTLVKCSGRLTADVAAEFKQEIRSLIPQTKQVVLDLNEVAFWIARVSALSSPCTSPPRKPTARFNSSTCRRKSGSCWE